MSRFAKQSVTIARRNRKRCLAHAVECLESRRMFAAFQVNDLGDVTAPDANITLREALALAAGAGGTDDVTFDPNLFTGGAQTITLAQGALNVNSNVNIIGPGEATLTINANALSRVFDVGAVTASMSGMTITNGRASFGGGISNVGNLSLVDMIITGNNVPNSSVGVGGGIYSRGAMSLTSVDVTGNTITFPVYGGGAGIYNDAVVLNILNGSQISGNSTQGEGGGIWNANGGTVNLTSSTANNNSAGLRGGAIFNENGTVNVLNSTLDTNTADTGGGIHNRSTLNVTGSTLVDNIGATSGGGISNNAGTAKIVNSTISGNNADNGGGITVAGGTLTSILSTIADNDATSGTGGGVNRTGGTAVLQNSIVAINSATTTTGQDIAGTFSNSSFNLIGKVDGSTGITNGVSGNKAGSNAVPLDPGLSPLANNGGLTETMEISTASPAFNAGSNALIPAGIVSDQRGSLRIVNSVVDMGAFENQTIVAPTQTPFPGPGNFQIAASGTSTLQAEDFDNGGEGVSWHDTTPGNAPGFYRNNVDVDIKQVSNDSGLFYVANTIGTEFTEYTVDVAQTGTYTIGFRVASKGVGGNFHLEVDDINVTGSISPPNTGDWNNWTTVTRSGINLTAGTHVLRLAFDTTGPNGAVSNVNFLTFTNVVAPGVQTLTTDTAAHIRDGGSSNSNFGSATSLEVKKSTTGFNRESWIKFNIASVTTISNAILRIRGALFDSNTSSIQLAVLQGNNGWAENTITFTGQPPVGPQITTKTISGTAQTTYDIDVTTFLQDQKTGGATEVTFVLRSNTTTATLATFASDENATVSSRPQLIVTS